MGLIGNVHLIAGSAEAIPKLLSVLRDEGIETVGNADLSVRTYRQFGVGDARELSAKAALRAVAAERRVFVCAADSMTAEAQNALLKTLEEAPGGALFFFIHPAPDTLLATVRSRVQRLELQHVGHPMSYIASEAFLRASSAKRLEMLKPLLEKDDDDKRDFGAILQFLASLERALEKDPAGLHAVYRARKFIGDKGALAKPLLEQIALLV